MDLIEIADETLAIIKQGSYTGPDGRRVELALAVDAAVAATELLTPAGLAALVEEAPTVDLGADVVIEVTPETTQAASYRLLEAWGGEVMALNFASARSVGGGFLGGARAQEEDLCRDSALYPCLRAAPGYYQANRAGSRDSPWSALYTDHMILSPRVPFFRAPDRSLLPKLYLVSVLTAPAPNAGDILRYWPDQAPQMRSGIEQTFRRRIAMIMALAAARSYRRLVLGAWGCGAFRGDPEMVAGIFAEELSGRFRRAFEHVTFAVLAMSEWGRRNYETFKQLLNNLA